MNKLLIGPALAGAGWIAGSHYGASTQQLVHRSPDDTYQGIAHAFDAIPQSGMTEFDGGKPMPYELRIDRVPDRQLIVHVSFNGREGSSTRIDFQPQDDGKTTMVTVQAHGDRTVLGEALAGTSRARLAYAPDWMLNLLVVRPLLQQMGQKIEDGEQPIFLGIDQAPQQTSADQQPQAEDQDSQDPTAPTVDPNADASRYTGGGQPN